MTADRRFFPELESLRGIAAMSVVLFHLFLTREPDRTLFTSPTTDKVANLLVTTLFNGTGAVVLFLF